MLRASCLWIGFSVVAILGTILGVTLRLSNPQTAMEIPGTYVSVGFANDRESKPRLVTCDKHGVIRFLNSEGLEVSKRQLPGIKNVLSFSFSVQADVYCVMTAMGEAVFGVFSTGEVRKQFKLDFVYSRLEFSHDGRFAWLSGADPVRIWRVSDLSEVVVPRPFRNNQTGTAVAVFRQGDSDVLASAKFPDGEVPLYDLESGDRMAPFVSDHPHDNKFIEVISVPNGRLLIGASMVAALVWDTETHEQVARLPGFGGGLGSRLAVSGDGRTLVYAAGFQSRNSPPGIRTYRTKDWSQTNAFKLTGEPHGDDGEDDYLYAIAVSHDGSLVGSKHGNGTVRLWVNSTTQDSRDSSSK